MDIENKYVKDEIDLNNKPSDVSFSPQTQFSNKNLEPPKENFELGRKKMKTMETISLSSVFNKNKKNKKKTRWERVRKCLHFSVDNLVFHIFVLFISIYSLFFEDIMILCLPTSVDHPFEYVTEAVFFFFFTEFMILTIAKKKFIGSFYFYLDIVSVTSLLPNVPLIWDPLMEQISGPG